MARERNADVLILGAGPAGLALALELHVQDVYFRILDCLPVRPEKSRAQVLHPRSLELLSRHEGIVPELLQLGEQSTGLGLFVDKKNCFELDFEKTGKDKSGVPISEYSSPLILPQAEIERVLEKRLRKLGVIVERPITAKSLTYNLDGVRLCVRSSQTNEVEEISAKYVVGCDGPHSFVRKAIGVEFPGSDYATDFTMVDCNLKWEHSSSGISMFVGTGFMLCIPLKNDVWRLVAMSPRNSSSTAITNIDDFRELLMQFVPGDCELSNPEGLSSFQLSHRIADRFRHGRCFLAGDAAHINNPASGQSMNTGIQDVVNLGWKFGRVLRGEVGEKLLDTYNEERRLVGERLLHGTDKFFNIMTAQNKIFIWLRNSLCRYLVPRIMNNRVRGAERFRFISQLTVKYAKSSIVSTDKSYPGKLKGGDRAPDGPINTENAKRLHGLLHGPGYHLLLFSGTNHNHLSRGDLQERSKSWRELNGADWVTVHIITSAAAEDSPVDADGLLHKRYGFVERGYVLVRPDGYISGIGAMSSLLRKL